MPKRGEGKRRAPLKRKRATKPRRAQIPDKASIVATEAFVSPTGRRYTIFATNQLDPYDRPKRRGKKRKSTRTG